MNWIFLIIFIILMVLLSYRIDRSVKKFSKNTVDSGEYLKELAESVIETEKIPEDWITDIDKKYSEEKRCEEAVKRLNNLSKMIRKNPFRQFFEEPLNIINKLDTVSEKWKNGNWEDISEQ